MGWAPHSASLASALLRRHLGVPPRRSPLRESRGAILGTSPTTDAWVFLVVGVVLIAASFGVLRGSQFARWIGIIAGAMLAITSIWFMPSYPVWSLADVAIGFSVVYGLAAYGGRTGARHHPQIQLTGDP